MSELKRGGYNPHRGEEKRTAIRESLSTNQDKKEKEEKEEGVFQGAPEENPLDDYDFGQEQNRLTVQACNFDDPKKLIEEFPDLHITPERARQIIETARENDRLGRKIFEEVVSHKIKTATGKDVGVRCGFGSGYLVGGKLEPISIDEAKKRGYSDIVPVKDNQVSKFGLFNHGNESDGWAIGVDKVLEKYYDNNYSSGGPEQESVYSVLFGGSEITPETFDELKRLIRENKIYFSNSTSELSIESLRKQEQDPFRGGRPKIKISKDVFDQLVEILDHIKK